MSDSEEQVKIDIKPLNEDNVFDKKPKPKRQLTEKQKEALAEGRRKAKAKRQAKLEDEAKAAAMKQIKKEQKDIEKANKIAAKEKDNKKKKLTQQEQAREKVKTFEKQGKIKKYNDLKTSVMEKCSTLAEFDCMEKILSNISEDDILDESKLKAKLGSYISSVKNYAKNRVK